MNAAGRSNLTARQLLVYGGQQLHPDALLADAVYAIRWPGLETERLRAAWRHVAAACDALRIRVDLDADGVPQQHVRETVDTGIEEIALPGDDVDAWISRRASRPLDPATRVFETAVLRPASGSDPVWYLNVHHVVADAAAIELLIDAAARTYRDGVVPELLPFMPFVARERLRRDTPAYQESRAFWEQRAGDAAVTVAARETNALRTTRQERVVVPLDAATGVWTYALLADAVACATAFVWSRIAGEATATVGLTFHNRRTPEERRIVGLLMEILPVRIAPREDGVFSDLLQAVSADAAEAVRHRFVSVANRGALAYPALVNVMRPLLPPVAGLDVRRIHPGHGAHALAVSVVPPASGRSGELWVDVNADLAGRAGATRIARHIATLLGTAARDPRTRWSAPTLLDDGDAALVLRWSRPESESEPPRAGCHRAFEAHAARAPGAIALVNGGETLRYGELNARANALAHGLRTRGAGRGTIVGVQVVRSPELIVAVLAIVKCGAAFLPLDPALPRARREAMVQEAQPKFVLTAADVPSALGTTDATGDLDVHPAPDDLAYVMYTSGSTGTPKGVLVTHGGVSNYVAWRAAYFGLTPADRSLHKASLAFDDAVWEIFEPLAAGARIVLAPPASEADTGRLARLLRDAEVTAACFVPSVLEHLIEEPLILGCALRRLTTGGETLSLRLRERVRERLPAATLYNGYGATETTVASTFWRCGEGDEHGGVPIGRPIANTRVYVLDDRGRPMPPGVVGEIVIGGAGVARGYLGRPELTAERFVSNPFADPRAPRLYRTGDRGRWRADGVLEFAGRRDDQVKLRGVRIELGEIEAVLRAQPGVRAAAAVLAAAPNGEPRLVAYVAGRNLPSANELRAALRGRLPEVMVPSAVVALPELPLTPGGKLDRSALPAPPLDRHGDARLAPRAGVEIRLAVLWETVLGVRPSDVRDDFFALGGDSLSAVRLASAIGHAFARAAPPDLLFQEPTIAAQASWIASDPVGAPHPPLVPLRAGSRRALYAVHQLAGEVLGYREVVGALGNHLAAYGLQAPGLADAAPPLPTIEAMAEHYVHAIRRMQPHGPYAIVGHSAGGLIAFEMARLLHAAGENVDVLGLIDVDATIRHRPTALDAVRFHAAALRGQSLAERLAYLTRNAMRWIANLAARPLAHRTPSRRPPPWVTLFPEGSVRGAIERAVFSYVPRRYPGAIVLFRATQREATGNRSRTLGWRRLARRGVTVVDVPGDHQSILHGAGARVIAGVLTERLCSSAAYAGADQPRQHLAGEERQIVGVVDERQGDPRVAHLRDERQLLGDVVGAAGE